MGTKILRIPIDEGRGLIFNVRLGKTLLEGAPQVVVVERDRGLWEICALRALDNYASATWQMGCDPLWISFT